VLPLADAQSSTANDAGLFCRWAVARPVLSAAPRARFVAASRAWPTRPPVGEPRTSRRTESAARWVVKQTRDSGIARHQVADVRRRRSGDSWRLRKEEMQGPSGRRSVGLPCVQVKDLANYRLWTWCEGTTQPGQQSGRRSGAQTTGDSCAFESDGTSRDSAQKRGSSAGSTSGSFFTV